MCEMGSLRSNFKKILHDVYNNELLSAKDIDTKFLKSVAATIIFYTRILKLIHLQIMTLQQCFLLGSVLCPR